jgi:hypothetical protein
MPKVPTYQMSQGVPRGGIGVMDAINLSTPYANAVSNVGSMLQQRGEQILAEYDTTKAYSAFNQLRDQARVRLTDLLSRESSSALGIQSEYENWERKARSEVTKENLDAQSQISLFERLAEQHRSADLNNLAAHEAQQHRVFKKQTIDGLSEVLVRDIRSAAFDDATMNGMIGDYFGAVDKLYPGSDKTAEKLAALEVFRVSAMNELIDKNPKYAEKKLEEWKPDLGDKYDILKKRLEAQRTDDKMTVAYSQLFNQFGKNYEAAMSFLAVPKNQEKIGLDFKEINAMHNRFSQLLSDRERSERIGRDNLEQQQKITAGAVLQSLYNPSAPKLDVHALHRDRKIDNATYEHAIKARESTVVDNPYTVTDLQDKIERGIDVTEAIRQAVDSNQLSEKTASSIGRHVVNEKSKRAMQYLDRALRPSDADKWSPDKHLKYADATRLYYAKVANGMDYEQASYEVVKGYIDGVRRTWKGLPTPQGLQESQKKDMASLEAAKQVLVEKLKTKQLSPNEYIEQMKIVDNLLKLAAESQELDEMDAELEALRKKKVQK